MRVKATILVNKEYDRQMRNHELAALFGVKSGHHLPDCPMETYYGEVKVLLLSKIQAKRFSPKATRPHRIMAECPRCKRLIPAGRMQQHYPTCKEQPYD